MLIDWFDNNPHWKPSTRHSALAAVKGFCAYEFGKTHPIHTAQARLVDPGPQRCLDEDELLALMSAINTRKIKGIRDLAIITLMVDTGLRVSELCSIELAKLNMRKSELAVKIKGGDWAQAVFFEYTRSCLEAWLSVRSEVANDGNPYVFSSIGGKNPGEQATPNLVRRMLKELSKKAGLERVTPHALRRTFATLSIINGAPTRVVQLAGRWKKLDMVERYSRTLLAREIGRYSVVNKLAGIDQTVTPAPQPLNLPYVTKLSLDQETDEREILAEMLETIAALPLDGQGATYGMYIGGLSA